MQYIAANIGGGIEARSAPNLPICRGKEDHQIIRNNIDQLKKTHICEAFISSFVTRGGIMYLLNVPKIEKKSMKIAAI